VLSKRRRDKLHRSHAEDVKVIWPGGHETRGMKKHIEDLCVMFEAMPDLAVTSHPVSFGSGNWTATIGVMEGTFTPPMPTEDGKTIAPSGKRLRLSMATIAHWKDGRITEEYLLWDNAAFMQQYWG
jgi:predicted ester cyclase